jgi:hypothetical protein
MIYYFTDNPEIKKLIKSNISLSYQIYDWRISISEEDIDIDDINFKLNKRIKKIDFKSKFRSNKTIIGIVSPSNYKLIFDLLNASKEYHFELKLYSWDSYTKKRKKMIKINKTIIKKLFNEYIQRGYLTKLTYNKLIYFNFQRIEQFMTILTINTINKINKVPSIIKIKKNDLEINTIEYIKLMIKKGTPLNQILNSLIYNQRKRNISDPFLGKFIILNNKSKIKKIVENIKEEEISNTNIDLIIKTMSELIPLTDTLKTLRYLEENNFLKTDTTNEELTTNIIFSNNEIKKYFNYININIWEKIYESKTFSFSSMFPQIETEDLKYKCPLCGSTEYNSSPLNFFCSDTNCNLYIPRIIKPGGIKKQISDLDFLKLINHGETLIKNKVGGYNKYYLIKENNKFKIIPKINKEIKE